MNSRLKDNIIQLSQAFGPSGDEQDVSELLMNKAGEENLLSVRDTLNNTLVTLAHHKTCRILLDAHIDEVGFMVRNVFENGTFNFLPLGGWTASHLPQTVLKVRTTRGTFVKAIVVSAPPHYTRDLNAIPAEDYDSLRADPGTGSKEETLALGIEPGCFIVPWTSTDFDEDRGLFSGKAFDDRLGAAVSLETFLCAAKKGLADDLAAVFTSQEEVGERGSRAAAPFLDTIRLCIAFEGCPADDTFERAGEAQTLLNHGPMIRAFDKSMITHPAFLQFAKECAEENDLPLQIAVRKGGGTNGGIYHQHNIPTIVIGVPVRYAHTPTGFCSLKDAENAVKLTLAILEKLHRLSEETAKTQADKEIFSILQGKRDLKDFLQSRD